MDMIDIDLKPITLSGVYIAMALIFLSSVFAFTPYNCQNATNLYDNFSEGNNYLNQTKWINVTQSAGVKIRENYNILKINSSVTTGTAYRFKTNNSILTEKNSLGYVGKCLKYNFSSITFNTSGGATGYLTFYLNNKTTQTLFNQTTLAVSDAGGVGYNERAVMEIWKDKNILYYRFNGTWDNISTLQNISIDETQNYNVETEIMYLSGSGDPGYFSVNMTPIYIQSNDLVINASDETLNGLITQTLTLQKVDNISTITINHINQSVFAGYDRATQIHFSGSPYADRTYALPAPTSGITYLNAYLINTSLPNVALKTFTVKNQFSEEPLENVGVIIQKLYGTSLITISTPTTNFQGQFQEYMDSSTNYNFILYSQNYTNRTFSIYPADNSYIIFMNPTIGAVNISNLTTTIIYSNNTGNITITWNDTTPYTTGVTIDVTEETLSQTIHICNITISGNNNSYICNVASYPGVIHVVVTNNESGTQTVKAGTTINTVLPPLSVLIGEKEGAWWAFGIILTCAAFGLFSPVGAIIATFLGLIMVYFLGLTSVITVTFLIIVMAITIIIGIKVRT